jgi:hypothetical protein
MATDTPQRCEDDCIMILRDPACADCEAWHAYWSEVDNSEMDIDWSEYADIVSSEWKTEN